MVYKWSCCAEEANTHNTHTNADIKMKKRTKRRNHKRNTTTTTTKHILLRRLCAIAGVFLSVCACVCIGFVTVYGVHDVSHLFSWLMKTITWINTYTQANTFKTFAASTDAAAAAAAQIFKQKEEEWRMKKK